MSEYKIQPGDRIKIAGNVQRGGETLPIGTMGTVVSVDASGEQAEVDWDSVNPTTGEPLQLTLLLNADLFWVEEITCKGFDVHDAIADGWYQSEPSVEGEPASQENGRINPVEKDTRSQTDWSS